MVYKDFIKTKIAPAGRFIADGIVRGNGKSDGNLKEIILNIRRVGCIDFLTDLGAKAKPVCWKTGDKKGL
ncbi:MAG: hypothetical protein JJE09_04015 [Bacteroidia bacterium]|nr:hypothetical protein [Bacteroidia bacterium]